MKKLLLFLIPVFLLASCRPHYTTNEYRDAKTHPSEEIQKGHKKAAKQADKDFRKNQKKSKKAIEKKNGSFFKKKKHKR